eukprot:1182347-Prorocentrum_minimum.AAC.3
MNNPVQDEDPRVSELSNGVSVQLYGPDCTDRREKHRPEKRGIGFFARHFFVSARFARKKAVARTSSSPTQANLRTRWQAIEPFALNEPCTLKENR